MARDPVCGMDVSDDQLKRNYQGQDYYFCSPGCQNEFDHNPERYATGATGTGAGQSPHGTGHQEIRPGEGGMEPGVPRREKREKKFGT